MTTILTQQPARPHAAQEPPPVHVAITRTVKPGCEAEFEQAIRQFFGASARESQTLGALLIRPLPGSDTRTYGILRAFASPEDRDVFYASDRFHQWTQAVAPFVEGTYSRRELHGLEAFFGQGGPHGPPPRWKMAFVTWLGVWPTSFVLASVLGAALHDRLPRWLASGMISACVVVGLSWAVMPVLVKLFKPWLYGAAEKE
jgi:antibiotic biosynthesis monooxygenase (ABM) superfamily enzyme